MGDTGMPRFLVLQDGAIMAAHHTYEDAKSSAVDRWEHRGAGSDPSLAVVKLLITVDASPDARVTIHEGDET